MNHLETPESKNYPPDRSEVCPMYSWSQIPLQGGGEMFVADQDDAIIGKVRYRFLEGTYPKGKVELRFSFRDGSQAKRRYTVTSQRELKDLCWELTKEADGKGAISLPTVHDAVADAIRASLQNPQSRDNSGIAATQFFSQVKKEYPDFDPKKTTIDRLDTGIIEATVARMHRDKLSRNTIRLYLQPIRAALNHAARKYRGQVLPCPSIRLPESRRSEIECLDRPRDLDFLLGWLKENRRVYYPVACLQALAGLRIREAIHLRVQDVDLAKGLIRIDETPRHSPKNESSRRVIPISSEVQEVLRETISGLTVLSIDGTLFQNEDGNPMQENTIIQIWKRMINGPAGIVRAGGLEAVVGTKPRSLRKSFVTLADRLGVPDRLLKRYIGQSSGDVMGRHYRKIGIEELRVISNAMETWRNLPDLDAEGLSKSVKWGGGA